MYINPIPICKTKLIFKLNKLEFKGYSTNLTH